MENFDIEIVGLLSPTNGRSCSVHACCGEHVAVGDVLRLVRTIVTIGDKSEIAVKCVKVVNGVDSCTVGFIPRVEASLPKISTHINKFVMVKELYHNAKSNYKRRKSNMNRGVAAAVLLDENAGRDE